MKPLTLIAILSISTCFSAPAEKAARLFTRIIGGEEIPISAAPYQVAVLNNDAQDCGGVILNANFVLTAGHCVVDSTDVLTVLAGTNDLRPTRIDGQEVKVSKIHLHPSFTYNIVNDVNYPAFDVAILEVTPRLDLSPNIAESAILPTRSYEWSMSTLLFASGWGEIENHVYPYILRGTTLAFMYGLGCYGMYVGGYIEGQQLCVVHTMNNTKSSTCRGDAGGPVVEALDLDTHTNRLVGVVSYGRYPCEAFEVEVNIANPDIRDFITDITEL